MDSKLTQLDLEQQLPPLQVIICHHNKSELGGSLAKNVVDAFRGNGSGEDVYLASMSTLPVPLRNFSVCPSGKDLAPKNILNRSLHSLVVLLVDEELNDDKQWRSWVKKCNTNVSKSAGKHFIVALTLNDKLMDSFQLIDHDPVTKHTQKISYDEEQENGEYAFGEYAERPAWFSLFVLQQCRHLLASNVFECRNDDEKLKLRLFISHAKKDSLPLANSLRSALKQKDFFAYWYDAEDLNGVEEWRDEIRNGVKNSAVIVLRTEQYDNRPWCRQEFLWANQCSVPVVCVEARNALEYGADTLQVGQVPTVRIPDGNLFRVLFLALKESLRIMQLQRRLDTLKNSHAGFKNCQTCTLIPYTPSLRNLTHTAELIDEQRNKNRDGYNVVLYADPPLRVELYEASKTYVEEKCGKTFFVTPTLIPFWNETKDSVEGVMTSDSLLDMKINISISEYDEDLLERGFSQNEMNGFVVQMAEAMIANEATVTFGHDWREDGVMPPIYRFAEQHQDVVLSEQDRRGLVENYSFWGNKPALNLHEREILKGVIDIIDCDRPEDPYLDELNSPNDAAQELKAYAFARSLTQMRKQMTKNCDARICLGGRDSGTKGRCPGVVEEALMSCLADQPLYLSGLLGGVTNQIINALENKKAQFKFTLPKEIHPYYLEEEYTRPLGESPQVNYQDYLGYEGFISMDEIIQIFNNYGIERLSKRNGLSKAENRRLFHAATLDEVVSWILTGLARISSERS
ncbi:MAG: TIR domain-containing protein [Pseudomonadota bacterium]